MSDLPDWLQPAAQALHQARSRGALVVSTGPISARDAASIAGASDLELVSIDARLVGLHPDGVLRAALRDELGGIAGSADVSFCLDAAGEGDAALGNWEAVQTRWLVGDDPLDDLPDIDPMDDDDEPVEPPRTAAAPADDAERRVETLARILAAAGDLAPRLVLLRAPDHADLPSLSALRTVLASGRGAGTAWLIEGPIADGSAVQRVLAPVLRAAADPRFDGPVYATITPADGDEVSPNPPGRGTAAELLAMLQSGGVPVPEGLLGTRALTEYRGQAPRATFQDLEGLLHAGRAVVVDGWVSADAHGAPDPGPLARADARALHDAVADSPWASHPAGLSLRAGLALAGELATATALAIDAGEALLDRGDALGAQRWLDRAASWLGGAAPPGLSLLRARAARILGDRASASRLAREALLNGTAQGRELAELHLEAGRLAILEGDDKTAQKHLDVVTSVAAESDALLLTAEAHLLLAELHEAGGHFHPGASAAAEAAKAFERAGDTLSAARAFATRAICIAHAGHGPRALQELKHAMKRTPDPEDPRPGALDVRIAMGLIFREAGDREKARQALGLAAKRAHAHALADREAIARLNLARFHLEALPVRGAERGEALSAGREAAEAAIQQARGVGRPDLEADAEALLGELAWRSEDWSGAAVALEREQELWTQAGNAVRVVDVALRRGQLASRRDDWAGAFDAANAALSQAQRRRLTSKLAQAHLLRGEALQHLERKDEALQSLQEAHRIFASMGDEFAAQAGAAERRARQLVAGG